MNMVRLHYNLKGEIFMVIFGIDIVNIIIIVFLIIITIIYWNTSLDKTEKISKFFTILSQFGILLFISQFVTQNQQRRALEENEKVHRFVVATERFTLNIENWFTNNYPYGTRLYKQLYPNHPSLKHVVTPANINENRQAEAEAHASALLIQAVSDAYKTENLETTHNNPEYAGWMASCKRWFSAPIILKNWAYLKNNYGETFQKFVDEELIKKNVS